MKVLTLLQARTGSTRLPGKVLRPLLGRPMILRQIERLQRASLIGTLCLVTSTDSSDDELAECVSQAGVAVFRGSLNDVLDRFYQASRQYDADIVVRLTGDCPLADPAIIDAAIRRFMDTDVDYLSNCLPPTYPDGLDVEVFRQSALEDAWLHADLPSQREHVTPYINGQPGRFCLGALCNEQDLSALRLTVDEPADFALVERIYDALYPAKPDFALSDILEVLERQPAWVELNAGAVRNAGYLKSLREDEQAQ